jgi:hypothetical protein
MGSTLNNIPISKVQKNFDLLTVFVGVFDQDIEEFLHLLALALDPPIPPLGVVELVVEFGLHCVVQRVDQAGVGREDIEWVAHADDDLVAVHSDVSWQVEWVMRLRDPDAVVGNILSLKALNLQRCGSVQGHRCAGRDTGDLLNCPAEERVSRARETGEANTIILERTAVEESELLVELPAALLKKAFIFATKHFDELLVVDNLGSGRLNSTVRCDFVTWELILEVERVVVEAFLCPSSELETDCIRVNHIFAIDAHENRCCLVTVLYWY